MAASQVNRIRQLLNEGKPTVATRMESTWPTMIEAAASTGYFDYLEFVAEYAPFNQGDLENMCRAAELHDTAMTIKVDFQNRAYVMQKAFASGFQGVLLTDHKTAAEIEESLYFMRADAPGENGRFGYPNRRWVGYAPYITQPEQVKRCQELVVMVMIEKKEALDRSEERRVGKECRSRWSPYH